MNSGHGALSQPMQRNCINACPKQTFLPSSPWQFTKHCRHPSVRVMYWGSQQPGMEQAVVSNFECVMSDALGGASRTDQVSSIGPWRRVLRAVMCHCSNLLSMPCRWQGTSPSLCRPLSMETQRESKVEVQCTKLDPNSLTRHGIFSGHARCQLNHTAAPGRAQHCVSWELYCSRQNEQEWGIASLLETCMLGRKAIRLIRTAAAVPAKNHTIISGL